MSWALQKTLLLRASARSALLAWRRGSIVIFSVIFLELRPHSLRMLLSLVLLFLFLLLLLLKAIFGLLVKALVQRSRCHCAWWPFADPEVFLRFGWSLTLLRSEVAALTWSPSSWSLSVGIGTLRCLRRVMTSRPPREIKTLVLLA